MRVLGALLACATATAQITVNVFAHSTLVVSTSVSPAQTILAGGNITPGAHLLSSGTASGASCTASLDSSLQVSPASIRLDLNDYTSVNTTTPFLWASAASGPNEVRIDIATATDLHGKFVMAWSTGNIPPISSYSSASAQVDLGNDGTIDFSPPYAPGRSSVLEIPLTIAAGTSSVRVVTASNSIPRPSIPQYPTITSSTLSVAYVPDPTVVAIQLAPACGTLQHTVRATFAGIEFTSVLTPPTAGFLVQVLGLQPFATPLPLPPGCTLQTDVVLTAVVPSAGGFSRLLIDLSPPSLHPVQFLSQSVWIDLAAGTAMASNTLRVDCR